MRPRDKLTWRSHGSFAFSRQAHLLKKTQELSELGDAQVRGELREKLSRDIDTFGEDLDSFIQVCTQIFSEFLREEYGGPGTLLVDPFTDMLVALKENNFSGATIAARTSILWAQNFVDQDWEIWNTRRLS